MRWLDGYLDRELQSGRPVYPEKQHIFEAFRRTQLRDVRVVIVGQDPYPNHQATGLAFAVPDTELTRSLRAIDNELEEDTGHMRRASTDLVAWANQGVLLLNNVLTVGDTPRSHHTEGWEEFTDRVIELVNERRDFRVIFCLWGKGAWDKARLIDCRWHFVLPPAGHPSRPYPPLPFSGCRHFSQVNRLIRFQGDTPIVW